MAILAIFSVILSILEVTCYKTSTSSFPSPIRSLWILTLVQMNPAGIMLLLRYEWSFIFLHIISSSSWINWFNITLQSVVSVDDADWHHQVMTVMISLSVWTLEFIFLEKYQNLLNSLKACSPNYSLMKITPYKFPLINFKILFV